MLIQRRTQRGVSLVELMVGLAVFAILIMLSAPAFSTYIQNTRIRNTAESIQNGLQLARAEAVRRNTAVRFQFTDTATSACSLSAAGRNWVISLDDPAGKCEVAPSETDAPRTIQKASTAEAASSVTVEVTPDTQTLITFNGMGRVSPMPATDININIKNPAGGTCATTGGGGDMRCLRVVVTRGGQVRMCDPARGSADPQVC